jgi:hypothetical protein
LLNFAVLISHPGHYLGIGIDIRGRDIFFSPKMGAIARMYCPAQPLQLFFGHLTGIAGYSTFPATEGNPGHSTLKSHPD